MHYIRLLRPPSLHEDGKVRLVFTITTDLGDSFLGPEQPVPISIYAHHFKQGLPHQTADQVKIDDGSISWRSGLRVLKLDLRLPFQITRRLRMGDDKSSPRIRIVASRRRQDPPGITELPFDTEGHILGLSVPLPRLGEETSFTATREFATPSIGGVAGTLSVDEEIGESIDRHVWDAGVVTTGLLFNMCKTEDETRWSETPLLRSILCSATPERRLNVIELGCGVGILGVGLATALSARYQQQTPNARSQEEDNPSASSDELDNPADIVLENAELGSILLTDLPDAEELTVGNILRCKSQSTLHSRSLPLEFESLDWEDGKNGVFGPRAKATGWDLVIISDCTYNVDMLSALVETISALYRSSMGLVKTGPKVMLATKPRHSSEKALFDLMRTSGWDILESATQPLPCLGLEDESVEIYLFGKTSDEDNDGRQSSHSTAKRRKLG